jgi:hypothetical protein
MRRLLPRLPLALLAVFASAAMAQPAARDDDRIFNSATAYYGRGVDLNLREFPKAIFQGDLRKEDAHFWGLGLAKTRGTLGNSLGVLRGSFVENVGHGYEVLLLQHGGRQDNAELGAAYFLRTPDAELGFLRLNAAAGVGMSHAFGTPTYEDADPNEPDKRYRTQFLLTLELEWSIEQAPAFSLVTRIHHRSGIYGLVAPSKVGSNFVVAGLRYRF